MKLSNFLNSKKIVFLNGEVKAIDNSKDLNGEINFFKPDIDKILELSKNIDNTENNEQFLYAIMPYVCDVEVDIDIKDFLKLFKNPNKEFAVFIEMFMELISDYIETATTLSRVEEGATKLGDKLGIDINELKIETINEKRERLYREFNTVTDIKEKNRILKQIIELGE